MFNKSNRLKKRKSFNYIHSHGKSILSNYMILKVVDTKSSGFKVGFSVSKKIGNAVKRNYTKRIMKEALRKIDLPIPNDCYFIIIAKTSIIGKTFEQVCLDMKVLIENLLKLKNVQFV